MSDTTDEQKKEVVEIGRIDRLFEALSLASVGAFDEAIAVSGEAQSDRFGAIEEALRVFLQELSRSHQEREKAMVELESSRSDLAEKLETIERQRLAISELSVPIIELWEDIITLPIVGTVDSRRAAEMTEKLLARINDRGAKGVIIDLTGVEVIDTMTAGHLLKLTRAAALLGSFCVLTGIGPAVASTMVQIGVDMGELCTARSLRDGLRVCLARLRA